MTEKFDDFLGDKLIFFVLRYTKLSMGKKICSHSEYNLPSKIGCRKEKAVLVSSIWEVAMKVE